MVGDEAFIRKRELDGGGDPIPKDPCPEDCWKLQALCSPYTVPMCRVLVVPLSWTLVICPCCPLCTETMDRAAPPQHGQQAQGLCRVWGLSNGWQQPRAHPGQGRAQRGPQGQQRWLRWMGCHGNLARGHICHQGGHIANRQVARYPRGGVASRVSSAADNLGQCGGKRNEGDLGTASR